VREATEAFVAGINAYVTLCRTEPALLPLEFAELGCAPALWRAADVARIRSHGLYYNLREEVARALTLRDFGPEVEELRRVREPGPHELRVPDGLDLTVIPDDVLRVYDLATTPPWAAPPPPPGTGRRCPDGSNNWVLSPSRTATGRPILANDPHRAVTLPSLRYVAHLSAPGLNVIGAGEPALPGISIGHNGKLAFGLTIFPIDQEDLYVYATDPADPSRYRYGDGWEPMARVVESIPVAGREPVEVELRFTRHGPVVRELPERAAAFAVRAAWLEPGMAPYLGSMGYMDADGADGFTAALDGWGTPGENQVYAAPDGTVGWRPAGRVPVRDGWDGTLPVPGDGRYEWRGHHGPYTLPRRRDPDSGWLATANEMNLPAGYPNDAHTVTYDWYAPYRHRRIAEQLSAHDDWTVAGCVRLQTDHVSLPARQILPLLSLLDADGPDGAGVSDGPAGGARPGRSGVRDQRTARALELLRTWNGELAADSAAAALFEVWFRRHLRPAVLRAALRRLLPADRVEQALTRLLPREDAAADPRVDLELLLSPGDRLGPDPDGVLRDVLRTSLREAAAETEELLGPDPARWRWGTLHRALLRHPVATLTAGEPPPWATLGPAPRGGSGDTVGAASYAGDFRQTGGATFRLVVDVGAWDESLAMNSPGQSGDPRSPHYADLFADWTADSAFPLLYSRHKIAHHTARTLRLRPSPGE